LPMYLMLMKVKKRLAEVGIKMNVEKSAVMQIVPNFQQKKIKGENFFNIPAVNSYKYLGIEIDSRLKFTEEIKKRKLLEKDLRKKEWIFRSSKIN
jgi:hypothetical protein